MKKIEKIKKFFSQIFEENNYLRNVYFHEISSRNENDKNLFNHCKDGDILIFEKLEDYQQGFCELFWIYSSEKYKNKYSFSYRIDDDGNFNEPPSSYMEDFPEFDEFQNTLISLVQTLYRQFLNDTLSKIDRDNFYDEMEQYEKEGKLKIIKF